jgi:DNA-binding IclR family transcriptional regulator
MKDNRQNGLVQSDRRLFEIISGLQELDGAGVTDLAEHLEMSKSTVYKHLNTLLKEEYVTKKEGSYHLGFKFLSHGGFVLDNTEIFQIARPKIIELSDKLDELTVLSIKEHDYGVYLFIYNDKYDLYRSTPSKTRYSQFDLHASAAGKAILAQLSEEEVNEVIDHRGLEQKTPNTICDEKELKSELARVREKNIAMNMEEHREGISGMGASFKNEKTGNIGAISITAPAEKLKNEDKIDIWSNHISETINEIELLLEY